MLLEMYQDICMCRICYGGQCLPPCIRWTCCGRHEIRCFRLSDESTSEALSVRKLLGHRLPIDPSEAKLQWYQIVEGGHSLWDGVPRPYRETIVAFLVYFHNEMARTRLTARKRVGNRHLYIANFNPQVPAAGLDSDSDTDYEAEVEQPYYFQQASDDSNVGLPVEGPDPAPAPAPAVQPPAPVVQPPAPAPEGNNGNEEEDPEEVMFVDDEPMEEANGEENNDDGDDDDDDDDDEVPAPPAPKPGPYTVREFVQIGEGIYSADQLRRVLLELGNNIPPRYTCSRFTHPMYPTYWEVKVSVFEPSAFGEQVSAVHHDVVQRIRPQDGIAEAARRALQVICGVHRPTLCGTRYGILPYRNRGEVEAYVPMADVVHPQVTQLRGMVTDLMASLNTALTALREQQIQMHQARHNIAVLTAQRDGIDPPPTPSDEYPAYSPSPRR